MAQASPYPSLSVPEIRRCHAGYRAGVTRRESYAMLIKRPLSTVRLAVLTLAIVGCSSGKDEERQAKTASPEQVALAPSDKGNTVSIAQTPARDSSNNKNGTAGIETRPEKRGSEAVPSAFDANSLENTLRWLSIVQRSKKRIPDNFFAQEEANREYKRALDTADLERIKWIVPISLIDRRGVQFEMVSLSGDHLVTMKEEQSKLSSLRPKSSPKKGKPLPVKLPHSPWLSFNSSYFISVPFTHEVGDNSFKVPPDEWIKKLRSGNRVTLQGYIKRLVEYPGGYRVDIRDHTLTPVD